MPALTSGRYDIKWTQLASLPTHLWEPYVTVQDEKIYVAGGNSPVVDAYHQVYVYNANTDHWAQLPPSGHCYGIPHIIGGRLAIIGGHVSDNNERTNKVSTFDETSQTWIAHYPDLLSVRSKPGVVTHLEHVIVAGGLLDGTTAYNDTEVLNWIENSYWRKVSTYLPEPMYAFTPIIADDHLIIVGYHDADLMPNCSAYKIPVTSITKSEKNSGTPTKWITMTNATQWSTALVPSSYPPVVVGGDDESGIVPTSDIAMYDDSSKSWKKIASLTSARSAVAIATVNNNAIIVIGGYTKGDSMANAQSSSLTTVELGQAQLLH